MVSDLMILELNHKKKLQTLIDSDALLVDSISYPA